MVRTRGCYLKTLHAAVFDNAGLIGTCASFLGLFDVMDLALASKTLSPHANRGLTFFQPFVYEPESLNESDIMCALIRRHPCVTTFVINGRDLLDETVVRAIGDGCRDLREMYVTPDIHSFEENDSITIIDPLARCTQMRTFHADWSWYIYVEPATFRAWTKLRVLVMDSPLDDACIIAIAESAPELQCLRQENCRQNHVSDDGVRALAALENLTTLFLSECTVGDGSVTFFLERRGTRLEELGLISTSVTEAIVDAIDAYAPILKMLDVSRTRIHARKLLWYVKRRRLDHFVITGCEGQDKPIEGEFRKLGYGVGRGPGLYGHFMHKNRNGRCAY